MSFLTILWWLLLGASAVALWRGTQSPTARAVALGALILTALSSLWESQASPRQGKAEALGEPPGMAVQSEVTECVACASGLEGGRWQLRAERVSGHYTVRLNRPEPYALSFRGGWVLRRGEPLPKGCTAGVLQGDIPFIFVPAEGVDLQVGPGARCP